jgi:hypothetical protein
LLLERIQNRLTELYDLPPSAVISQFLIDRETLRAWSDSANCDLPEQVLVQEHADDTISFGLFLGEGILDRLGTQPSESALLQQGGMNELCHAVEAVSHFLCLDYKTSYQLPVTGLELELQAEIDKFITCAAALHEAAIAAVPALYERLFKNVSFRESLSAAEAERYRMASEAAAKFCRGLVRNYFAAEKPNWSHFRAALRRFYRQSAQQKFATARSSG